MISLHSHSGQFCKHAKGRLEEVILEAIKQGFTTYGLSEHMPRYRKEELYPEEQDSPVEDLAKAFDEYVQEGVRLKGKYASQIEILIGFETEFITPDTLHDIRTLLDRYSSHLQYIVGSVHHVNTIPIDFDKETFAEAVASFPEQHPDGLSQLEQLFCSYFDAQYELIRNFHPEVIGHFDLCRLFAPQSSLSNPHVWSRVKRNVNYCVAYGALIEVNAAAFRKGWKSAYPAEDVLELIKSANARLTLSDDSHGPHAVGLHYKDAHLYLVEQNVQSLWSLTTSENIMQEPSTVNDKEGLVPGRLGPRLKTIPRKWDGDWSKENFWMNRI